MNSNNILKDDFYLMFLDFAIEIGRIEVAIVGGELEFLIDPALGLIAVAFKLLQTEGIFKQDATLARLLQKGAATVQQQSPTLGHVFRSVVLTFKSQTVPIHSFN